MAVFTSAKSVCLVSKCTDVYKTHCPANGHIYHLGLRKKIRNFPASNEKSKLLHLHLNIEFICKTRAHSHLFNMVVRWYNEDRNGLECRVLEVGRCVFFFIVVLENHAFSIFVIQNTNILLSVE